MKKTERILGILGLCLLAGGTLFKSLHWPGASIQMMLAVLTLNFGYLTLNLFNNWRLSGSALGRIYANEAIHAKYGKEFFFDHGKACVLKKQLELFKEEVARISQVDLSQEARLLRELAAEPMEKQNQILLDTIEKWQGKCEQIDDMVIVGIKI